MQDGDKFEDAKREVDGHQTDSSESSAVEEPEDYNIWMRGLFMIIFAILFGVAEVILCVFAVLQFLWMLFAKERNQFLADTGETLGNWLREVVEFQTGATDDKPFPWRSLT